MAAKGKSPARMSHPAGLELFSGFNLHPTGQPEHDPILGVDRHAVNKRGPQALIKLGDEIWQVFHGLDEPLDLSAADHNLIDLLHHSIALALPIERIFDTNTR